jgi:predicted nucleotidyltransferase
MKPSEALDRYRPEIRAIVARHRSANPRVFGSARHGRDREGSDLDLLVDPRPDASLFDLGAIQYEVERLVGVEVDVLTPDDLPDQFRARVLREAEPV